MSSQEFQSHSARQDLIVFAYEGVIDRICDLNWNSLDRGDLINVAWVYYYFSVQFRENLEIARSLYPNDDRLYQLDRGERDTDNLSPWPGVAAIGERMNHDEFMRRTLELTTIAEDRQRALEAIGHSYLTKVRALDKMTRALSIASYEDGGLEKVFRAILKSPDWDDPLLQAFKHFFGHLEKLLLPPIAGVDRANAYESKREQSGINCRRFHDVGRTAAIFRGPLLTEHIRFDSDPKQGHDALCRHLKPNDLILPLWAAFEQNLVEAALRLKR